MHVKHCEQTRAMWRTLGNFSQFFCPIRLPSTATETGPGLALAPVWAGWLPTSSTLGLGVWSHR